MESGLGWTFQCPKRIVHKPNNKYFLFLTVFEIYLHKNTEKHVNINKIWCLAENGENKQNAMIMLFLYTYVWWIFFQFDNNMRKLSLAGVCMKCRYVLRWLLCIHNWYFLFLLYYMLAVSCDIVRAVWVSGDGTHTKKECQSFPSCNVGKENWCYCSLVFCYLYDCYWNSKY